MFSRLFLYALIFVIFFSFATAELREEIKIETFNQKAKAWFDSATVFLKDIVMPFATPVASAYITLKITQPKRGGDSDLSLTKNEMIFFQGLAIHICNALKTPLPPRLTRLINADAAANPELNRALTGDDPSGNVPSGNVPSGNAPSGDPSSPDHPSPNSSPNNSAGDSAYPTGATPAGSRLGATELFSV